MKKKRVKGGEKNSLRDPPRDPKTKVRWGELGAYAANVQKEFLNHLRWGHSPYRRDAEEHQIKEGCKNSTLQ